MSSLVLQTCAVSNSHCIEYHRAEILVHAGIDLVNAQLLRVDHLVFLCIFLQESKRPLIHHPRGSGPHQQDIKMIFIRALKRSMEIFTGMQVAAVHPLHFLQRADGKTIRLRIGCAGTHDIQEWFLKIFFGKYPCPVLYLFHCRAYNPVRLFQSVQNRVIFCVGRLLKLHQFVQNPHHDALRSVLFICIVFPAVYNRVHILLRTDGLRIMRHGDDRRATLDSQLCGLHSLPGISAM